MSRHRREDTGPFRLDVEAILRRRPELEATVLASAVAARRSTPVAELPVRGVGQELFQALFTREVYGTYRASLGAAQHSGQQLRVVLRLSAPELAAMPWEMLFDPETESYLCQTEPLLRHIPTPDYNLNPLDIVPPLRILGIIAAPRDLPGLDVDAEKAHLAQALAGPISEGTIELVWASSGTWDDVQSKLLAGPWHVVHFIGHGDYDARTDEGRIALVGAGSPWWGRRSVSHGPCRRLHGPAQRGHAASAAGGPELLLVRRERPGGSVLRDRVDAGPQRNQCGCGHAVRHQ